MAREKKERASAETAPEAPVTPETPQTPQEVQAGSTSGPDGVQAGSTSGPDGVQAGSTSGPDGVQAGSAPGPGQIQAEAGEKDPLLAQLEALKETLSQKEEQYLRLCAEYDNYRKRTTKEKESAWQSARGETVRAFLPVYDDLERALRQETADSAYRKGVEMTMTELKKVLEGLGLQEIPALGETFDANLHNAVMHVEDPDLGANTVKEVYQTGFKMGDSVIRYAMVVVAN